MTPVALSDSFMAGQFDLLERIARGAPLNETLEGIVLLIEGQTNGMMASVLLVDQEQQCVRHGAAPNLPPPYAMRLDGMAIGPAAGSCGAAAFLGECVIVDDIATHPNWVEYRDLALPHGLAACWSSPIFSPERVVLGTFAMYYRERRGPTDAERQWVTAATHLASIAILRHQSEHALRRSEARAQQLARFCAVSTAINEAIVRVHDVQALYEHACRTAVEQGLARLAWIGTLDAGQDCIRAVAQFGAGEGYVDRIMLHLRNPLTNRGPAGRAIRSGAYAVSNDIAGDSGFYFKQEATALGLRSCAVFPLKPRGQTEGVFAIYTDQIGSFGAEELAVLGALADDISFAVELADAERERQHAAQALRASEERLRAVVEHTPNVAIQWYDEHARVLFANRTSQRLFGWTAVSAAGRTLDELNFSADGASRLRAAIQQVITTAGPVGPMEFRYRRSDSRDGVLLSTVFAMPLTGGDSCFARMDVDITDYRDLQERSRAEETLRALVFSSVSDVIFYLSVEPGGRFRYISVNPAFHAATGLSEEQVIGKLVEQVVPAPLLATVLSKFGEAIRSGQPVQWEEVWAYQTGERHGEATVTPLVDESGRCTNLLGTVHDITTRVRAEADRRALEVQLHQSQRMQSLGTLAGGIAHDFNNILTAITGYADIAAEELPPDAPAQESVAAIRKAGERASELVRQILTFSRQDAPERRALALQGIVDEAVTLLRATLSGSVRIRTHIAADTPCVLADATQVHQTLMNLGTNAAHAVGGKGTIDVRLETVLVDSDRIATLPELVEGRYVVLSVTDSGRGMDQITRARVFEPFFTTKTVGQGTGLGLSVVHGIMRSHHGTVTVESELGQGATFRLYFPAVDAPVDEKPAAPIETLACHSQHLLYVDDEEALVFLTSRVLRRLGYRVTGYTDAAVALQAFRASPGEFDVVVTDTSMPGLSGLDFVREVLRLRFDIPVVMVSGYMQPDDLELARRLGVTEIVLKPHTSRELGAAVERVIGTAHL